MNLVPRSAQQKTRFGLTLTGNFASMAVLGCAGMIRAEFPEGCRLVDRLIGLEEALQKPSRKRDAGKIRAEMQAAKQALENWKVENASAMAPRINEIDRRTGQNALAALGTMTRTKDHERIARYLREWGAEEITREINPFASVHVALPGAARYSFIPLPKDYRYSEIFHQLDQDTYAFLLAASMMGRDFDVKQCYQACKSSDPEAWRAFVNQPDPFKGQTPLEWAVNNYLETGLSQYIHTVEALLEVGAEITPSLVTLMHDEGITLAFNKTARALCITLDKGITLDKALCAQPAGPAFRITHYDLFEAVLTGAPQRISEAFDEGYSLKRNEPSRHEEWKAMINKPVMGRTLLEWAVGQAGMAAGNSFDKFSLVIERLWVLGAEISPDLLEKTRSEAPAVHEVLKGLQVESAAAQQTLRSIFGDPAGVFPVKPKDGQGAKTRVRSKAPKPPVVAALER